MKCEKCGGMMNKMDEHTMKCEGCGAMVKMDMDKDHMMQGDGMNKEM